MQLPKQTNPKSSSQNVKPLLPDQAAGNSHADSYSRHFLDELHQLKAQLHSMLGQQRQMMQSQISHQWSAAPRSDKPQWWQSPQFPPITSTKLPSLKTHPSPQHYSFILLNVFHLLLESGKNKSKVNYFSELHCNNLMFIALCETYLTNDILDAEVDIPGFSIVRCDRLDRIGGGVCIYVRESLLFEKCLNFSNSVCELLIIKILNPQLVIILLYRPPSCSPAEFIEVLAKMSDCICNMPSPLPHVIFLGDFNLPNIDWVNARFTNLVATHLCPIIEDLFLEQLVQEPTRGNNILDLIFSEKELIDSINVTKTCLSDHSMLLCHTLIPICSLINLDRKNLPSSVFESLNFRNGNWDLLRSSISDIDWISMLSELNTNDCYKSFIDNISLVCCNIIPKKKQSRHYISQFFRDRKALMRKRTKILKKCNGTVRRQDEEKLQDLEKLILQSHKDEQSYDEAVAVNKIRKDPNFFFRYAKKFSLTNQIINCLSSEDGLLINDKDSICKLFLKQFNSVFSKPNANKIVHDSVAFFNDIDSSQPHMNTITINEATITEAISEISGTSACGPDGMQASFFKNCFQRNCSSFDNII